jgi:endo-alpha-1,4-polygalactosaminidase (GH114 family)
MKTGLLLLFLLILVGCERASEDAPQVTEIWQPVPMTTFQWQLTGTVYTGVDAQVYDIDAFEASQELVDELHQKNIRVIAYISAGSYEDWRPDTAMFPKSVIGNDYAGWSGEKWLDIRQISLLAPVMQSRLDMIRDKGFDGVEPDNIDGYENNTGFPISKQDELTYIKWLTDEAHSRGLSIGQKNAPALAEELWPFCNWALVEESYEYGWGELMTPYIQHNKAVFAVEYSDAGVDLSAFCSWCGDLNFTGLMKNRDLDEWRQACSK